MERIYLVRTGRPDKSFEFKTEPDPEPLEGQVRIRVRASGLNFADVMARLGLYPDAPALPCVVGYEVAGVIDKIGPEAQNAEVPLKTGMRVMALTAFGGYSSHLVVPAGNLVPIPDQLGFAEATALGTQFCTAWYSAEEAVRLHPGDHVLIQAAAGGVGTALVQMAKRRGCVIYGTASAPEKLKLLKEMGVDHPINYRVSDFEEEIRKIRGSESASNGRGSSGGLDVVFDSVGGTAFKKGMRLLNPGGRMITFGVAEMSGPRRNYFKAVKMAMSFGLYSPLSLLSKSTSIIGVNLLHLSRARPHVLRECMRQVVELTSKGELRPLVGATFSAREIAKAHELLGSGKSVGKVAVIWPDQ